MKRIACPLMILLVLSCNASKELKQKRIESNFAYVLPLSIEDEIWRLIKSKNLENADLFFQMRREKDYYHLLITPTKEISTEYIGFFKVLNSNRKILLNDKLYLIVFDSDYDFGSLVDQIVSLDKRKEQYLKDEYTIRRGPYKASEFTFGIKFTKMGQLVQ